MSETFSFLTMRTKVGSSLSGSLGFHHTLRLACPSAVCHERRLCLLYGYTWEQLHLQPPVHAHAEVQKDAPRTVHNSLRKFLSLLYEDPKMQILIGSHRVCFQLLAQLLDPHAARQP